MTKLKNTKKGMAKKALSISLVAAMLATSNVPVWAAEFTDGTDAVVEAPVVEEAVDTFSAEAEAPVVEEEVNDVATYASTAEYDFSGVTIKKNTPWKNTTAVLGGTIKKDGTNIATTENLKFKWVLGGVQQTKEANASDLAAGSTIEFTKDAIGQKLEAIFYTDNVDNIVAKLDLGTVQAMDIAEEFNISKINDQTYNGKEPKDATITLTAKNWSSFSAYATQCGVTGTAETWFSYDYNSTKGANAGSVVTVTAKLKDDVAAKLGYTGSVSTDYNITKCTWLDVNDVDITINNTSAGEYTGNKIELPGSAATVKLKDTDIELPIEKVVTKTEAASDSVEVQVYYDTVAMNATGNFDLSKVWEHTASTKVSIAKRDLSKVNAKLNVTYTVENVSSSTFAIKPERLTITDADNNVLNLKNDINVTLKSGTYDKPGTYEDAIVITAKTANCVNKTYADLVVTKKNFDADKAMSIPMQ